MGYILNTRKTELPFAKVFPFSFSKSENVKFTD